MKVLTVRDTNGLVEYIKDNLDIKAEIFYSFSETVLIVQLFDENQENLIIDMVKELAIKYGRELRNIQIKEI